MVVTTVKGGEAICLRGRPKKPASLHLVDGFPIQDNFNFLPNTPDPSINRWSYGKVTTIEVWGDWWFNYIHGKYRRTITWKGQTEIIDDYPGFCDLIKSWMDNKWYPKTKEEALDLWFEMSNFMEKK
jgi:hypothetical protein